MKKNYFNYLQGIFWFTLSLVVSCSNDAITKYVGFQMSYEGIAFFRCFLGALSLVPMMLYYGSNAFRTQRLWLHLLRGSILFIAISLWTRGIQGSPLTTATVMSFTIPVFILLLAPVLLKEHVNWSLWLYTLLCFSGIILVLNPSYTTLNKSSLFLLLSAFLFGLLDVINKKYVTQEPILCMLFYSNLIASLQLAWPALHVVNQLTKYNLYLLSILGASSNLILFFLLKAFSLATASSLAPFRYLELLISIGVGYFLFQELPTAYSYIGTAIILPCTLMIAYTQRYNG